MVTIQNCKSNTSLLGGDYTPPSSGVVLLMSWFISYVVVCAPVSLMLNSAQTGQCELTSPPHCQPSGIHGLVSPSRTTPNLPEFSQN